MKTIAFAAVTAIGLLSLAGCKSQPTQADLELQAYERVLAEKVEKKQMSVAEADLARQQYLGNLRARESNIAASYGVANQGNAYAQNSTALTGLALVCAGQRGGCR
jgi:hypothetical protein